MSKSKVESVTVDEAAEMLAGLTRIRELLRNTRVKGKYKKQVDDAYTTAWQTLAKVKLGN